MLLTVLSRSGVMVKKSYVVTRNVLINFLTKNFPGYNVLHKTSDFILQFFFALCQHLFENIN